MKARTPSVRLQSIRIKEVLHKFRFYKAITTTYHVFTHNHEINPNKCICKAIVCAMLLTVNSPSVLHSVAMKGKSPNSRIFTISKVGLTHYVQVLNIILTSRFIQQ